MQSAENRLQSSFAATVTRGFFADIFLSKKTEEKYRQNSRIFCHGDLFFGEEFCKARTHEKRIRTFLVPGLRVGQRDLKITMLNKVPFEN
jgi:hypothetical protein